MLHRGSRCLTRSVTATKQALQETRAVGILALTQGQGLALQAAQFTEQHRQLAQLAGATFQLFGKALQRLADFAAGHIRVLVTKSSIAGWGLNWQHCRNVAFVGVTDSWEAYYQAVRRCYRFGQKREVHVHIFASEQEGSVVANLKRKEADAKAMGDALASEVIDSVRDELMGQGRESNDYTLRKAMNLPNFLRQA